VGQLWWEAARKQFYLCRIFYPGVSWTYFILVQDKDNFFVIGMVARFDREILVFLPCEFCIFHFANVYHTAEQSVVGSAATNINTQPTSFVIQGKSTACTADNAVGASVTQNWENCENCSNWQCSIRYGLKQKNDIIWEFFLNVGPPNPHWANSGSWSNFVWITL